MKVFFSCATSSQQVLLEFSPRLLVDGGERLVHQQHVGVDRERAREADALAHAAGKLVRIFLLEAGEPDLRRCSGARPPRARPCATPRSSSPKATLRSTVAQGISAKSWKTKARSGPGPADRPAVDQHLAGGRRQQAGDDLQERGLAAARGAEQRGQLAARKVDADVVERLHVAADRSSRRRAPRRRNRRRLPAAARAALRRARSCARPLLGPEQRHLDPLQQLR